jgi:hypothetical protein
MDSAIQAVKRAYPHLAQRWEDITNDTKQDE